MSTNWDDYNFIDFLDVKNKEVNNLPQDKGISISTMCSTCKINTILNIPNIKLYLQLNPNDILTVKMNKEQMRTLIAQKNKPKRMKKTETRANMKDTSKNHFYNQITIVMRVTHGHSDDLNLEPRINIKLFKNGSVQMSGCKSLKNINIVLNKLICKLKEVKAKFEDGAIIEKTFIEDMDSITVKDFKIDMINSNYQVAMQIDRDKLYNLLQKKKVKSLYEPCIRAPVIIKFVPIKDNIELKEVSVFVFQKGNIIITGARSKSHIISAYDYMNEIILTHKDEIIKKDELAEEELILDIYNDIMKDVNIGLIKI